MKAVLKWLGEAASTSEGKCTLLMAGWALAARFFPGTIPLALPPIDFSAIGMGTMTLSPATLGIYVLTRCAFKAFTDGKAPFRPEDTRTVTTVQPADVATRTVIDTPAKKEE